MRSRREAFVGSSRCGSSALPASTGAEAAVLFLLDFISAKNSVHLGRQREGEKPSPLCLLGEEPLADSSLGRLEGCAEASSRSAARGGWGPLPCSALWSPVRQC